MNDPVVSDISQPAARKHRPSMTVARAAVWLLTLAFSTGALAAPAFDGLPERDRAGFFTVAWESDDAVVVEMATDAAFSDAREVYSGADRATTLSGLSNGNYYFRIRAADADDWAETGAVEVEHHSLARALAFFLLGAVVFIVLIVSIVRGAARAGHPTTGGAR